MSDFQAKVTAILDTSKLESQLKGLSGKHKIDVDVNLAGNGANFAKTFVQQMASVGSVANSAGKTVGQQFSKGMSSAKFTPNLIDFAKMKQATQVQVAGYSKQIQSNLNNVSKASANSWAKSFNNQLQKQSQLEQTIKSKIQNQSTKLTSLQSQATSSQSQFGNATAYQKMTGYIKQAESAQSKLNAEMNKGAKADLSKVTADLKEIGSATKGAETQFKNLTQDISRVDAFKASNSTLTWLKNNSKATKVYGAELTELAEKQKKAFTAGEQQSLQKQVNMLKTQASAEGMTGISTWDNFTRGAKQIGQFVGIYGVFQQGLQTIKQMASAVVEVDSAMTELRKVSDAPAGDIDKYFETATASAKKYGSTISDVINSTADWSRLGYSLPQASKLSDATTLLTRVGDNMTQETSSQGLISILRGFQLGTNDVDEIIDIINEVANNEPIDTAGIVSALQRSASSLSTSGNSLSQSVAMVTAANSVVQDPDSIGTAFKTMSMRIRGAKTELQEASLDTDGMAESTAKLREEMQALSGIDIMKDKNTFKSTYNILDELADRWSGLSDIQQASVTELVAGKRQGNIMSALMTNWDVAEETMKVASGSEGSADRELKNVQQSVQYSIDKLKAQFQELSTDTLQSGFLKGLVDFGTGSIGFLDDVINKVGILKTAIAGFSLTQAINGGGKSCY